MFWRRMSAIGILVVFLVASPGALRADVKLEEKTKVQFGGLMGRMFNLFGGRTAREGLTNLVAVHGNRKMVTTGDQGELIDLDEEKIYNLDLRRRTYRVTTFEERRRELEKAGQEARKMAAESRDEPGDARESEEQYEIDVTLRESGERKTIHGFDCREVIMTVTVREKDKTLEESGGMVLTSNLWLAPEVGAMREVEEFDRRYAEKLEGSMALGVSAAQLAQAMALYPGFQEALGKFEVENANMEGTVILSETSFVAVKSQEELAREKEQGSEEQPTVGGLLGGFGRKIATRRKAEEEKAPEDRVTVMTATHEVLRISTDVAASDVAIPAGFRERR